MKNTYTLYMLSFPDGYYYFGSTNNKKKRKKRHKEEFESGTHYKKIQEQYNIYGGCEFIELDSGSEYDIKCKEHFYVKDNWDDSKLLNTYMPAAPHILKIKLKKGSKAAKLEQDKNWSKTTLGRLGSSIQNAKNNIKLYTKQKRWDMVDRWNIILAERLVKREEYKSLVS